MMKEKGNLKEKVILNIFPIYKRELKIFIPLCLISLCISYNFSLLRGIKDIFILKDGGATAIYYLKLLGVTPSMLLITYLYTHLSKTLNMRYRFNIIIIYFILFFLIFSLLLHPNNEKLKLIKLTSYLDSKLPNMTSLWSILRNWHSSLFYIHAEAWGNFVLSVIFWTFANHITSLRQSKRFYGFFAISSNIGAVIAGLSLSYFFKGNLSFSIYTVVIIGIIVLFLYNVLQSNINNKPIEYQVETKPKIEDTGSKISFIETLRYLFKSQYLMTIVIMVVSYGFAISIFEAIWKENMREYVGTNSSLMASLYGKQLTYIGIVSILLSISLNSIMIKRGWKSAALFTPIVFAFACLIFFIFIFFGKHLTFLTKIFHSTPLRLATMVGLANVVFIKASKYSFFDTSKETAYIPLDEEAKVRGKAAIDANGQIFGKSLGAIFITVSSIFGGGGIRNVQHWIAISIILIIIVWLIATNKLGNLFNKLSKQKNHGKKP